MTCVFPPLKRIWPLLFLFCVCLVTAQLRAQAAVVDFVGEDAPVVGAAQLKSAVVVATANGVWRREAGGKFVPLWRAPQPGTVTAGPLAVNDRLYVVADNTLWVSPAAATLDFKPVAVGAAVWALPRQVHDRWIVQTEQGVRQSRALQKWEPLFPEGGIEEKHLAWHAGAWWALANPPPATSSEKPTAPRAGDDVEEGEEADYAPALRGGMLGAATVGYELRRSTDLKSWKKVRDVDASLISVGLFSFGGQLLEIGEAGVTIIPVSPDEDVTMPEASEGLVGAVVSGKRLWLTTGGGVLVSQENDPAHWTWMDGTETNRELSGAPSALSAWGDSVAIGSQRGRFALLRPADQERVAAGGLAFAPPAVPAGLVAAALPPQTKQVAAAGGKYLAITWAKNGLWAAEPGGAWRNVAAFGQAVNSLATLGDRALAVVDYSEVLLWDAAAGKKLPVDPLPEKSFSTVQAVNGRFFGISSAGRLFELVDGGRWQPIALPSDDPNFGVQSLVHHDGHFLVTPVREAGLYRTADFKHWTYAPMQGGNTRFGRLFNTGRRLLAVHHYGERDKDDSPVNLAVSTDGVAWQEIAGIVAARDSYFRAALHDRRRHVLVFTRELWVSEGDEAQTWRRVPVEQNSFFELAGDRLVAATPEGLMVRDAGAQTFVESAPTRVARSLATSVSWQAAGPEAVAERKKQEALAKAAADAIPRTVAGAEQMAAAFLHFEDLYVSGASRRELAQQAVGVHEAVRKHRPTMADEVAESMAITVINLQPNDLRIAAYLVHHLPGFRKQVQALYGKSYSGVYWNIVRSRGQQVTQEFEIDIIKELLMSHTDSSYLRRVTFPKIPQNYPTYEPDAKRVTVALVKKENLPFSDQTIRANLEKGWAGAALDRDIQHAAGLDVRATTALRPMWILAARVLWPDRPPVDGKAAFERPPEEKARLGSLLATDQLALDAREAGKQEEFAKYRDLAVQRGMQASRYVSYAQMMADNLKVMNEATANVGAAMAQYNQSMSGAVADLEKALKEREALLAKAAGASASPAAVGPAPSVAILSEGEEISRDIELKNAEAKPAGKEREAALAEHREKWDEKIRFRKLALQLKQAAGMPDAEADGFLRTATLQGIAKSSSALFGTPPRFVDNRLQLASLFSVVQNTVPRERHAPILDRILRDVPTLADVWVLRAGYHIEAKEWALAEGSLAIARMLNPKEPSLEKMENRLDAQRPALTNADLIRQQIARSWEEAEDSVDDELRSRDPAADYATGLEFEQGKRGDDMLDRMNKAEFYYMKAALADHVPAMLGYARVANARLQDPDLSETTREATEKGMIKWVNKAADLGNGEALRVRALWRANGQAGLTADRGRAWTELESAVEAGDLVAARLLIQAAQAGEWKPAAADAVEKLAKKLADAGEADAIAWLKQRDAQNDFNRLFWGERGMPAGDPQAAAAAVPTDAVVIQNAPRSLVAHLQLARPSTTTARAVPAARALVIAMLGDGRIDAAERALLVEAVKPSFRLRVVAPADAQGPAREVVFLGSYQPQARAYLERFIPPAGSDRPVMTPLMQRYFWIWTGVHGWKQAIAHAEANAKGRREIIDVIKGWLSENWSGSSAASGWSPLKDELTTFKTVLAQLTGKDHTVARALLLESCQELDKGVNDAVPDFLYAEFKDAPAGK